MAQITYSNQYSSCQYAIVVPNVQKTSLFVVKLYNWIFQTKNGSTVYPEIMTQKET